MRCLLLVVLASQSLVLVGAVPEPMEDATCAMQMAVQASSSSEGDGLSARPRRPHARRSNLLGEYRADDPCPGEVKMASDRLHVTNNLGGLGPTVGPPVIHVSPFVELADGRTVDLTIANLTNYSSNSPQANGLQGEFTNINLAPGFVDLLLTFTDTETGGVVTMPPFNLTVYDLDGPRNDVYAESVSFDTYDITSYKLTETTNVTVSIEEDTTEFGSSAVGEACDNPTSIETLGVVVCNKSGTVDQADRAVAVQMKGGVPNYHITLRASDAVRTGRNFRLGAPSYFNYVCKVPESPTTSPTASPTALPTAAPTAATKSPTAAPTAATKSPTAAPTGAPTSSPTTVPTTSPTPTPTLGPATSFGDPHVTNVKGQSFEIRLADHHEFLVIPRGADPERALLHVRAKVEPRISECEGLYVTGLVFHGQWLGEVRRLEFATDINASMHANKAIRMRVGSSPDLNVSQFRAVVPAKVAKVEELRPAEPHSVNGHVALLRVTLRLGPATSKVRMVYQKEKHLSSNSLWLTTTGLYSVEEDIGGILGMDAHDYATRRPERCSHPHHSTLGSSNLLSEPRGSIHAEASFKDSEKS